MKRIVPRQKSDSSTIESQATPLPVDLLEHPPSIAEAPTAEIESAAQKTEPATRRRRRTPRENQSVVSDASERIVRVRCGNCGTSFQFKTAVDMVYKCRECSETIHVRLRTSRIRIVLFSLLGVAAVTVLLAIVLS